MQRRKANVEEIGSQRKMRSMLLQNAEREQARSFRLLNRRAKVSGGELFPFHGKLRLAAGRSGSEQKKESGHANSFHKPSWARDRKSTRLNSSHGYISYAVFCLKKKKSYAHAPRISLQPTSRSLYSV